MSDQFPAPEANPALIGHEAAEELLLAGWQSGRLAHAWLITGPKGVGKATMAYRIARFVLNGGAGGADSQDEDAGASLFGDALPVAEPDTADGLIIPDDSQAFDHVARRIHPDMRIIERTVNEKTGKMRQEIVIDDVRATIPFLRTRPTHGGWRVIVVDGVDLMNRAAQNAILKTLEEPPPKVCLLLTATNPGRLLPTIRSRCRMLPLAPLSDADMTRALQILHADLPPGDLDGLIELSEGSPGRALDLSASGGLETLATIRDLASGMPGQLDLVALHKLADDLSRPQNEADYRQFADLWVWWLDHLLRIAARGAGSPRLQSLNDTERRLVARLPLGELIAQRDHALHIKSRTDYANLDRRLCVLELACGLDKALSMASAPA